MAAEMAEQIGARIKARRDELGLTQAGLAAEITGKTTGDQVSRWERGKHLPRDMNPIAEALGVETSYFYAPEADKSVTPDLSLGKTETSTVDARLKRVEDTLQEVRQSLEELHGQREGFLELLAAQQEVLEGIAAHLGDDALRNRADKAIAASIKRARAGVKASEARASQAATPGPAAEDGTSRSRRKSKA